MPAPKIIVDQRTLRGFRRRALAALPLEHIESIWGRITAGGAIGIYSIHPFDMEKATKDGVEVPGIHVESDTDDALEANLSVLGTIHSHPWERDSAPSEHDWWNFVPPEDIVIGTCAIHKNKTRLSTRIRFYLAHPPLEVKLRK